MPGNFLSIYSVFQNVILCLDQGIDSKQVSARLLYLASASRLARNASQMP